ncbi:MAG: hypothetical protein NXI32_20205 [bacterium]|nr:hypothetical protein [bacterium]
MTHDGFYDYQKVQMRTCITKPPLVVSLCGLPGSGKSTLLNEVVRGRACCRVVAERCLAQIDLCDETTARMLREESHFAQLNASTSLIEINEAKSSLQNLRCSRPIVFVESDLGRLHPQLRESISIQIWVVTTFDRIVMRLFQRSLKQEAAELETQQINNELKRLVSNYDSAFFSNALLLQTAISRWSTHAVNNNVDKTSAVASLNELLDRIASEYFGA